MAVKFNPGQLVITRNAHGVLTAEDVAAALVRHMEGDWGQLCDEDRAENDRALVDGERLLSVYRSADDVRFWVITEADRSVTTVLLPEDY